MYKDATLCTGEKCPYKDTCKRHIWYKEAVNMEDEMYSVFMTPPLEKKENNKQECEFYWGDNQTSIMDYLKDIVNGNN